MNVKLLDLYKYKIYNSFYYIIKILYFIVLLLINFLLEIEEINIIYKITFMLYLLSNVINLLLIKIKQFDLFFISKHNKVYFIYIKLLLIETMYLFLFLGPFLINFNLFDTISILLYYIYYLTIILFIFISSPRLGPSVSLLLIFTIITNSILDIDIINLFLLNLNMIDGLYISTNLFINFIFLIIIIIITKISYNNATLRNIL